MLSEKENQKHRGKTRREILDTSSYVSAREENVFISRGTA